MDANPLQSELIDIPSTDELIDAVISFVNAKLNHPNQISCYFNGTWKPVDVPRLRTCRSIQNDVRLWLMTAAGFDDRDHQLAMLGLEDNFNRTFKHVDRGIWLKGYVSLEKTPVLGGYSDQHVLKWYVSKASLRNICGLAVQIICEKDLHRRIGVCERESCRSIFLDRRSRGIRRKYCKSEKCEKILNRERAEKSRKKVRK